MQDEQKLIGALLKIERIKQDRSQKEVCHSICVPSYLSKIEYGTVKPDEEILEKLYKRLGIYYLGDSVKYLELKKKIEEYYYLLQYGMDTNKLYAELLEEDAILSYSVFVIDWLIIKGAKGVEVKDYLKELKSNMSPIQRAYNRLFELEGYSDSSQRVADYEEAAKIINNSYAMIKLCIAYFLNSDYVSIHQLENKVIAMALEEGNTYQMAEYYILNGSAYACLNMEEMMMANYTRGIRLLQNTKWRDGLDMCYYNIGATYISLHKYELALEYLLKANACQKESQFFTIHKIALAYIRSGEKTKGREFLDKLKNMFPKELASDSLEFLFYKEATLECNKDFLDDAAYVDLLETIIKKIKQERHFGYLYFYKDVIVKAYIRQRKYKKALEFQKEISDKAINLSSKA